MKKSNLQETKSARVIQVIETVSLAGDGTDAHPVYEVRQYWSLDGKPLAKAIRSTRMTLCLFVLVNRKNILV